MVDRVEAGGRATRRLAAAAPLIALLLTLAAPPAADAAPLVRVENAKLERGVITARVEWNRDGIDTHQMTVGDVRAVAVSARGHIPTLLGKLTARDLASRPTTDVRIAVSKRDLESIRPGNRVVLTASQHAPSPSPELRTPRTYVTVEQLQKGAPPDAIGQRGCAGTPIVAQAVLERCDLVGAYLRRAQVSAEGEGTKLLRADLTGADLREADLTRADIAGGRVNGADASGATIDRVSLAGAEGTGFHAQGSAIDSSDFFNSDLDRSHFEGSTFTGTSLARSRFERAQLDGATIVAADMKVARLAGADLRGATLQGDDLYFADLTDANLRGATLVGTTPETLFEWATLCRTTLPDGSRSDRDCIAKRAPVPKPEGEPFVKLDAKVDGRGDAVTISGRVRWNPGGITTYRMTEGELRVVAIDANTGLPKVLAKSTSRLSEESSGSGFAFIIKSSGGALREANRLVVTATQHPPRPQTNDERTTRSYVTVATLRPGPGRGRVGSVDCSDRPISVDAGPASLRFCDLAGADLARAELGRSDLRMAELTGADLRGVGLESAILDGAHAAGVPASGAALGDASLLALTAPRLSVRETLVADATFFSAALAGADFTGSTLSATSFATARLPQGASFKDTRLVRVDLAYTDLRSGDISGARGQTTSLFESNLTDATLRGATFTRDEEGRDPPQSATLCRTRMPGGNLSSRDCPGR